jgi:hypothetical protein
MGQATDGHLVRIPGIAGPIARPAFVVNNNSLVHVVRGTGRRCHRATVFPLASRTAEIACSPAEPLSRATDLYDPDSV